MGSIKLSDIIVAPLQSIETVGGDVLHALKQSDTGFAGFGEVYFSWIFSGAIKAWKRHTQMTMNVVVPVGQVRFVFCATNEQGVNEFRSEEIGISHYARITVPPGIWFGFQGMHEAKSLILNVANITHDPNEVERLAFSDINYVWS